MEVQDKFGSACGLGRLISMVSHQMKRQRRLPETESGLTNMQRLILHYILFQSLERDIYQKDIEREFKIRRSSATGILQLLEKHGFIRRKLLSGMRVLRNWYPRRRRPDSGNRSFLISSIWKLFCEKEFPRRIWKPAGMCLSRCL